MDYLIPDYIRECVRSLPPLPAAVQQLISLARQPNVDFRRIAKIIQSDPTLTARTLRLANSAFYGAGRRVQTIRQAIVLLGRDSIVNLAISVSALNLQDSITQKWPLDPSRFWRHGIAVALTARALSQLLRLPDPEQGFVAGLLHDIGKLILLSHYGDEYAQLVREARRQNTPLHLLEQEELETDHVVAGHALCLHWNIPAPLTRALGEHHDDTFPAPNTVGGVVHNANTLVKIMQIGDSGNPFAELCPLEQLPHNQIRPDQLHELILELPRAVYQAEQTFGTPTNGRARPKRKKRAIRPIVHLHLTPPREREVLRLMLLAMGFEPVLLNEAPASAAERDAESSVLAGYITDLPLTSTRKLAYEQYDVPILHYGAWQLQNDQPTADHINVTKLKGWLGEHLAHAAVGSAEAEE